MIAQPPPASAWTRSKPPLLRFLDTCLNEFSAETSGAVADYIPELGKADPAYFGISLATLDGHVYEVGDSRVPFTIQSMSKPFVFALALDLLGANRVESAIGVEPSGDPFNSIRLNADNHPFGGYSKSYRRRPYAAKQPPTSDPAARRHWSVGDLVRRVSLVRLFS